MKKGHGGLWREAHSALSPLVEEELHLRESMVNERDGPDENCL